SDQRNNYIYLRIYNYFGTVFRHTKLTFWIRSKYNLNMISHDTAIELIRRTMVKGVAIKEVYVDTVGDPGKYQAMIEKKFLRLKVTVSKKADSLFPIVSAASIVAKVRSHARETGNRNNSNIGNINFASCQSYIVFLHYFFPFQ